MLHVVILLRRSIHRGSHIGSPCDVTRGGLPIVFDLPLVCLVIIILRRLDKPIYRLTYPLTSLKQMWMREDKADNNAGVLAKLLVCQVALKSKVNKVLDNLNNPLL